MAPLLLTLGRGALAGIGKKPSARARLPQVRLSAKDVRIDAGRAAAYAEVCGFSAAGPHLPLTYPHILGFPLAARIMARRDFPLPMAGLVHTSLDITAHGGLTARDRPELVVYAVGLRPHRRGTEVVMATEARLDGETVWEERSTYLARHRVAPDAAPETADGGGERAREAQLPPEEEWPLGADLGWRHARVSGDYNPIHLHPLTARPFGYRRPIAHGMWTIARCVASLPPTHRVRAEFRTPVLLPTTVAFARDADHFQVHSPTGLHLTGTVSP